MITKEQFNSVWKDTSKEGILNQFYYEHIDLMKYITVLDEIRELVKKCSFSIEGITNEYHDIVYAEDIEEILDKVNK